MVIVLIYQGDGWGWPEQQDDQPVDTGRAKVFFMEHIFIPFMEHIFIPNVRIQSNPPFQGSRPSQSSIPEEDDAEEWFDN